MISTYPFAVDIPHQGTWTEGPTARTTPSDPTQPYRQYCPHLNMSRLGLYRLKSGIFRLSLGLSTSRRSGNCHLPPLLEIMGDKLCPSPQCLHLGATGHLNYNSSIRHTRLSMFMIHCASLANWQLQGHCVSRFQPTATCHWSSSLS